MGGDKRDVGVAGVLGELVGSTRGSRSDGSRRSRSRERPVEVASTAVEKAGGKAKGNGPFRD